MRSTSVILSVLLSSLGASAQVLSPQEIRDPRLRDLQQKYLGNLKLVTRAVNAHTFPYHFYFSRTLDLGEKEQQRSDQRSVQFDRYQDQVVLKITGNYFAAYSAELMKPEERARQTFLDVILPLLQAAGPPLAKAEELQAFAFEVSHHVRKKVLGVSSEGVENVVIILPKASAQRLAETTDSATQQAAILEGEVFLNAAPISLWPPPEAEVARARVTPETTKPETTVMRAEPPPAPVPPPALNTVNQVLASAAQSSPPVRVPSPEALKKIQAAYQANLDHLVEELSAQAHFVRYAPPAFIPFHNGIYAQLSITTMLPESATGSQYKLAALAFDQHVAHLLRPALAYFSEGGGDFDGIDVSTSVRLSTDQASGGGSVAVEFIFPLNLLRVYAHFDCTGQQLIDASFVLINGERVSLNLQAAEAGVQPR